MNNQKAIIFDLDGTLIDSLEDIAVCMNQVLKELKLPFHEIVDYKRFVGGGIDILVENALDKSTDKTIKDEVKKRFKEVYDHNLHAKTLPYEGIYDLLDALVEMDYKIGVLSNKPHKFTVDYANSLFSKYNFHEVHGQKDHIEKKPHPKAAIDIANSFDMPCEKIYFVGDTNIDMQTAKNAHMTAIGVLWGFRDEEELRSSGADFIVEKPSDILDILNKDKYIPIACHFYDELESAAVKRTKGIIVYLENNIEKTIEDLVIDFKNKNKEEFAVLKSGLEIRLDRIISFNGLNPKDYNCSV